MPMTAAGALLVAATAVYRTVMLAAQRLSLRTAQLEDCTLMIHAAEFSRAVQIAPQVEDQASQWMYSIIKSTEVPQQTLAPLRLAASRRTQLQASVIAADGEKLLLAIGRNHAGQFLPGRVRLGQRVVLNPLGVTLIPLWQRQLSQPLGRHHGQLIQGCPHCLAHPFQAIEPPHGGQHISRIGALSPSLLDQPEFPQAIQ